jgi:hypothetical protein
VQGSVFVDTNLDEERITSGLPVIRPQLTVSTNEASSFLEPNS